MNKITVLNIQNFQKHSDLILNFNQNVNVISGLTDTGKSSIFRALAWVLNFSSISESDYRREGTKETSVKVGFKSGYYVERIRSNTLNRYILSKEDCEDKVFDAFGKDTPDEIAQVIGFATIDIENEHIDLNFASQDQLNFLLDSTYPDTLKAKLFNKLTGHEVLDKLFKELNKESLRFSREIKNKEELLQSQEEQLEEHSLHYKTLKKQLSSVKEQYNKVKEELEIYEHLVDLSSKLTSNNQNNNLLKDKINQIKIISDEKLSELRTKAERLKELIRLDGELERIYCDIQEVQCLKQKLKIPQVDFNKLKNQVNSQKLYNELHVSIQQSNEKYTTITKQIKEKQELLGNKEKELKDIWKECNICPLCQQEKHE